jgi:acetyl-CoA C-acetyltransferase
MRPVEIVAVGWTPVGEHWERSLADLALEAAGAALEEAGGARPPVLFVGSALAGPLSGQEHLGALLSDRLGLGDAEAHRVEAEGASAASALRLAQLAIAGGAFDAALVVGVEKVTDLLPDAVDLARAAGLDADREAAMGLTHAAAGALLMARYLHENRLEPGALAPFPILAHHNAMGAGHAFLRREIDEKAYARAPAVARPLCVLDCAPDADGAAAVVVRAAGRGTSGVRITGSAAAHAPLALAQRREPTLLEAAARSAEEALQRAGRRAREVGLFEPDDSLSILAALSLEAVGFADRGHAARRAREGSFARGADLPICTFGGSKARGNPVGASGLYRVVEAVLQLRGTAGDCQVPGVRVAMAQSLGGLGATAVTQILE